MWLTGYVISFEDEDGVEEPEKDMDEESKVD